MGFLQSLARTKTLGNVEQSKLARCLTLLDLSALGVGSTLGLGVYVLAGSVAKTLAGPAVCISFLVAAIASGVAGVCYAEFASRVPRAGSAYVYSYVTVGEFIAFIIGWNLILEYVIGTASVASGLSNYIDALTNKTIRQALNDTVPIRVDYMAPYPDFLAFLFVMLLTALLARGVKESSLLNNLFTAVNLTTIGVVLVAGAIKSDPANWSIPKNEAQAHDAGDGGFVPWGIGGIMAGAAKCFYGFVGFDAVATTGEEAQNPKRNIPLAIVISIIVIFLSYFGVSTVLTMMLPYYEQDADAPFPYVFDKIGWTAIKWVVTIGALFALCASLLGAMFPLPRVIYAMSNDGLIFKFLSKVNGSTKTPIIATVISGIFAGLMVLMFDLQQLIDMMSIGTLLAYTIVAMCILLLRYKPIADVTYPELEKVPNIDGHLAIIGFVKQLFNLNMNKYPSSETYQISSWCTGIFFAVAMCFCAFLRFGMDVISPDQPGYLVLFIIICIIMVTLVVIIGRQPVAEIELDFKVAFVPVIPAASIIMNLYLMFQLDDQTWIRFGVWLVIGLLIYFLYGIRNSEEGKLKKKGNTDRKPSTVTTTSLHSQKTIGEDEKKDAERQITKF